MYSGGITAKTTLMENLDQKCTELTDECIDRIHTLCNDGRHEDAIALYDEYKEWICGEGPQQIFVIE